MKYLFSFAMVACMVVAVGCNMTTPPSGDRLSDGESPSSTSDASAADPEMVEVAASNKITISPGPDAQKQTQEAFILAEPGDVIEFAAGKFDFDGTLSLDGVNDVVIRGQGMEETILSFAKQRSGTGGEGLKVKADNFTIEDVTLEDSPGDAIKLQDCNGITMRRVRTRWTNGPDAKNGAYGLYPVLSKNVLIEHCVAECASDAGIYVGQSEQVVVRRCRVERNVAGIEIENCIGADVYENVATNNTGGVLVFSLPGLTLKNGSDCRVFKNEVVNNNHPNFANEGAMVSTVPPGSGLMIMANDRVEVFENTFRGNVSASCLVVSFLATQRKFKDPEYDPYPEAIHIHNNEFADGGTDPHGEYFALYTGSAGLPLPDIVIDGVFNEAKSTGGVLPEGHRFSIVDNGGATFVNLDIGKVFAGQTPEVSTDLSPYAGTLARVAPVSIPGVE